MIEPLQLGVPGAPELAIILVILLIPGAFVGWWVYRDAKRRRSPWAWQWGVVVALLFPAGLVPGLLGVVIYLLVRRERPGSLVISGGP